jgi:hypothetical protein
VRLKLTRWCRHVKSNLAAHWAKGVPNPLESE